MTTTIQVNGHMVEVDIDMMPSGINAVADKLSEIPPMLEHDEQEERELAEDLDRLEALVVSMVEACPDIEEDHDLSHLSGVTGAASEVIRRLEHRARTHESNVESMRTAMWEHRDRAEALEAKSKKLAEEVIDRAKQVASLEKEVALLAQRQDV